MHQCQKFLGVVLVILCLFLTSRGVFATTTVAPATGGSTISADTTGGAYTSLTGPIITEGTTGDIGAGTVILNAPSGFIFDTGGIAPTVLITWISGGSGAGGNNVNNKVSGTADNITSITTTQITFTVTAITENLAVNSITWQNVRVRPTAGTPLASGNIVKTGTSTTTGVTNSITNLGTLTEVAGAKTQLVFITQPSTTATTSVDFMPNPAVAVRDQFGNTVTSDNTTTITRTAVLSTQSCGGTAGSGALTSTPASGTAITSGIMTYTAMQYSFAESIKICATSSGITSALSNTIVLSDSPPTPTPTPSSTPAPAEPAPFIPGGGGGNSPARIIFSGKAFPEATLGVYLIGDEYGQVIIDGEFKTKSDGSFQKEITSPAQEQRLYGLLINDRDGNPAKSKFFTYDLKFNTIIRQENIIFAPTIRTNKSVFTGDDLLLVSGYAAPGNTVEALEDYKVIGRVRAETNGIYQISIKTKDLVLGVRSIKTRQLDVASSVISDVSETKTFRVGDFSFANIDFNQDGQINISDWSIFLSNWSSADQSVRVRDDLNGDGKINVSDFSVFLTSFQLNSE